MLPWQVDTVDLLLLLLHHVGVSVIRLFSSHHNGPSPERSAGLLPGACRQPEGLNISDSIHPGVGMMVSPLSLPQFGAHIACGNYGT